VRVRLTPSGGADRIDGVAQDAAGEVYIKARVRAAPEKGQANAALEALLAKSLGVPKSNVQVTRGASARMKVVSVVELDASVLERFLAGLKRV
jgi:uncharacterized protein YggU (UPF0235/DUF167 family)